MTAGSKDRAVFFNLWRSDQPIESGEIRVFALYAVDDFRCGGKGIMRYLRWFLRIALFLLLLGFTVRNVETVTLHYYFGYEWHAPLVLIILLFFALGVAIGIGSCLGKIFSQRREISTDRKRYPSLDEHR